MHADLAIAVHLDQSGIAGLESGFDWEIVDLGDEATDSLFDVVKPAGR